MQEKNEGFLLGVFTGFFLAIIIFGMIGLYLN